jgi:hypothetical protein
MVSVSAGLCMWFDRLGAVSGNLTSEIWKLANYFLYGKRKAPFRVLVVISDLYL